MILNKFRISYKKLFSTSGISYFIFLFYLNCRLFLKYIIIQNINNINYFITIIIINIIIYYNIKI